MSTWPPDGAYSKDARPINSATSGNDCQAKDKIFTKGERNIGLASVAGRLWKAGIPSEALEYALECVNSQRCQPPLDKGEVRTIAKSIQNYDRSKPPVFVGSESETKLVTECIANVEAKPVIWMWKDRIPKGMLTVFSGDPDVGKSTLTADIVARYTTGRDYPDGSANALQPKNVLMLIAEDDIARTIKPRLDAAGADLNRVFFLESVRILSDTSTKQERRLTLDTDLAALEGHLTANKNIGLVIVDPFTGYLGKRDANKEQDVRRVLEPLKELCERLDVTFIAISHFNKRSDIRALHKVGGAVAMSGVPRAVWLFAKNPEVDGEYLMMLGKGNLTKKRTGMKYRIAEKILPNGIEAPVIVWQGEAANDADAVLDLANNPEEKKAVKAAKFLQDCLAVGPRASEEIVTEGKARKLSRTTLFDAKKELGIRAYQEGKQWWWELPLPPPDQILEFEKSASDFASA